MNRAVALALAALALPMAGCSLLGLDAFEIPRCTSSAQCQPLNDLNHVAATDCHQWQCVNNACALGLLDFDQDGEPGMACGGADCDDHQVLVRGGAHAITESCDGLDNDCNGMIDDGALVPAGSGATVVSGIGGMTRLTYAHPAMGDVGAAYAYPADAVSGAGYNLLTSAMTATPATLNATHYESTDVASEMNLMSAAPLIPSCTASMAVCDVEDLAVDAAGTGASFFATINGHTGCPGGQLLIGALEHGTAANAVVQRGPAIRSDVYAGVDVGGSGCTGASRASGATGAARPAIGASSPAPPGFPQAIVAWLGDAVTRSECGGASADVDALGVWLETAASEAGVNWIDATGSSGAPGTRAVPQKLGATTGGGAPAVVAAGGGYVVAYGNMMGALELRAIAAFANPATPYPTSIAGCEGGADTGSCNTPRATQQLTVATTPVVLPGTTNADHVAIAVGPAQAGSVELGLAWQEGCGTAAATIRFERVTFTPDATGGRLVALGAPVTLTSASDAHASQPSLAYVPTGFVRAGFARGGATATDANSGGWMVVWIDAAQPAQVMARRVAEFDGAPLEPAATVTVGAGSTRLLAPTVYPSAASPSVLALAYGDAVAGTIVGGGLLCAPPAP